MNPKKRNNETGDGPIATGTALNTITANKAGSLLILPYLFAPEPSFCYYNKIC
jgi:hypothetical protein